MDNPKDQLVQRLKEANNVLVTVSRDPSVDQLAAAIGLTLMLNKLEKHATAVFSGRVPSTLEFLQPEETIEKTTDSLRDFIISLDKSKADKLRYKVEDKMVKIFITPYRTSITQDDLVFSQGDFNVDLVVGIGVREKEDLDQAITSHGRILHDATVASVNTTTSGQLGTINWVDAQASSLSEMLTFVSKELKADGFDAQMATAFLTGIVAETDRFSNEKTTSDTMNASALLMAAGANQQLVATKLQEPIVRTEEVSSEPTADEQEEAVVDADGSLHITHADDAGEGTQPAEDIELPEPQQQDNDSPENESVAQEEPQAKHDYPILDEDAGLLPPPPPPPKQKIIQPLRHDELPAEDSEAPDSRFMQEPPTTGGMLTANTVPEQYDPAVDPLSPAPPRGPMLSHESTDNTEQDTDEPSPDSPDSAADMVMTLPPVETTVPEPAIETPPSQQTVETTTDVTPEPASTQSPVQDNQTLTDLEKSVDSVHLDTPSPEENINQTTTALPDIDAARQAIDQVMSTVTEQRPTPVADLNATGLMSVQHQSPAAADSPSPNIHIDPDGEISFPSDALPNDKTASANANPLAPPPVPPPMMPAAPQVDEDHDGPSLPPVNY